MRFATLVLLATSSLAAATISTSEAAQTVGEASDVAVNGDVL
jgi:hypothetical protein